MILTITCNPAYDVTYRLPALTPGQVHRVQEVLSRPGGKGVNVARVLHQIGAPVLATGLADAAFGQAVAALGIPEAFIPALPRVRRTVVVHAEDATTSLWEPGPPAPAAAADALLKRVGALLPRATALVVSGSLPPGVDPDVPFRLARLAVEARLPVVLDLDDEALRRASDGSGAVLVPNRDELGRLTDTTDAVTAARELSSRCGAPVVATLGSDGMVAVTGDAAWRANPVERVDGNPTGAGDAATAAIARGLAGSRPWPDVLADAVALSAAAVVTPVAGEVDLDAYEKWRPRVAVEPIPE